MEHIKEISEYLKNNRFFVRQEDDPGGRRWHYEVNGNKEAYIWFKWALNGWNLIKSGEAERHNIESVDKLKQLLAL